MPNYRRAFVPGGTYFFTLVTEKRRPLFESSFARSIFGQVLRESRERTHFEIDAIVLLHDHLHAIWSLPPGDMNYSSRWGWIKKEFTKRWLASGASETEISSARHRERRRSVWQPRFWEHSITDEADFDRHFDYLHYNPVKHGYVKCPYQWPHSSFQRWVKEGVYPRNWACGDTDTEKLSFHDLKNSVGE